MRVLTIDRGVWPGRCKRYLRRMTQVAGAFSDERIASALRAQLGWTHFRMIIPLDDELKRDFYAKMCCIERWSSSERCHESNWSAPGARISARG